MKFTSKAVPTPNGSNHATLDFLAGGGELGALMREKDWSTTPLGPAQHWPQSLRISASTCLHCPFPIVLFWGPELRLFYNDAYMPMLGAKHPAAVGAPGQQVWAELWPVISPMLDRVMRHGETSLADDLLLMLERHGYPEEDYFSFSYSPIRTESGAVSGVFCPVLETTGKVIGARRLRALSRLGVEDAPVRGPEEACRLAASCLVEEAAHDLPFVALYLPQNGAARLCGTAGCARGSPAAPERISLDPKAAEPWPLTEVAVTGRAVLVRDLASRFPSLPCGAWGEPPGAALVVPIGAAGAAAPAAFMVAGLSPHRPIEEVREFAMLAAHQVAIAVGNARAYEEERRRTEALTEIDRGQKRILEMVAAGAPLRETLDALMLFLEAQEPGARCSLLVVAEDGQHFRRGSGPHLPEAFHRAVDGASLAPPYVGSCCEAVHCGAAAVIADMTTETRYAEPWRNLMLDCGSYAIHSTPVRGTEGRVLASLAFHYDRPRDPAPADPRLIDTGLSLAAIAIERARAEQALRDTAERLRMAFSAGKFGHWELGLARTNMTCSDQCKANFGRAADEPFTYELFRASIHPEDRGEVEAAVGRAIAEIGDYEADYRCVWPDGSTHWINARGRALAGEDGRAARMIGVTLDITDRKTAEDAVQEWNRCLEARVTEEIAAREQAQARLAQAQRMEALGQLAGGIAHDFNNVLQAVSGGLSLIGKRADQPDSVRKLARMASDAAARGAAITGRLLAFARRGELRTATVRPAALLAELREMLAATLGRTITVGTAVEPGTPPLLADKAQLETVLINLAVNARDAMPAGGELTLTARAEAIADQDAHPAGLASGAYVRLDVADSGTGMDTATLARASEPFFSTKGPGQGTGLGLAMARGFAQQSDGGFAIRSALGQGTTITLWFPRAIGAADARARDADAHPYGPATRARVLVVDDDSMVRAVLVHQVAELGYEVTATSDGLAALDQLDAGAVVPDLLITDFSMPGMNGLLLIDEARRRLENLPALLLTGFADSTVRELVGEGDKRTVLLRKPVTEDALAEAATRLLARGSVDKTTVHRR